MGDKARYYKENLSEVCTGKEEKRVENLFTSSSFAVSSTRIIYTPSSFARSSLIHLQETGKLQALHSHKSERSGLSSCLFFTVLSGAGELVYEGKRYELNTGDCVFIDCKKAYSHETGRALGGSDADIRANDLWSLSWCHFYGPNMNAIYRKYKERGGKPMFQTQHLSDYHTILKELYRIADSDDYVRDMRIHEKLSSLLILLMEDAWLCRDTDKRIIEESEHTAVDIQAVKEYIDLNFKQKLTIEGLSSRFFINKYYLMSLFKERYGVTINAYLNQLRVTYIKQNLRFTEKTVETLAVELDIEPTYLSRLFKKIEGVRPSEYRKQWKL